MAVEGYTLKKNGVPRTGPSVDALLDKIDGIGNATTSTAGLMSASDKSKLDNISAGAEVNVQSDWNETDNTKDAFIKNRPGVENTPTFRSNKLITSGGVYSALSGKQSTIQTQASIGQSFGVVYSKSSTTRVDISDFTLIVGGIVSFYNSKTQMPNGTLKINSDGTSYPIYNENTQVSSLPIGIVSLMFDGTHWQYLGVSIKGIDSTPTANSDNLVKSAGVYTALENVHIDVDDALSSTSENPLQNKATKAALDLKADKSTTYTKTEVNNLIPSVDNDIVIGTLPASGEPNTIYRVPGTNSYTDYAWDGTQFIALGTFTGNGDIDATPTEESTNPIQSGGVYKALYGGIDYDEISFDIGYYGNTGIKVTSNNKYSCTSQINVTEGDKFDIKLYGTTSSVKLGQIVGWDNNNVFSIIEVFAGGDKIELFTVPANISKIVFVTFNENYDTSASDYYAKKQIIVSGLHELLQDEVDRATEAEGALHDVDVALGNAIEACEQALVHTDTINMFVEQIQGYFEDDGTFETTTSTAWLTSGKYPVSEGEKIEYYLCMTSANKAMLGVWGGNGNYQIVVPYTGDDNTRIAQGTYIVPSGVQYVQITTLTNGSITPYGNLLVTKSLDERVTELEKLRAIPSYIPQKIYSISGMPLRLYPYNLVAVNAADDSVDVFVKRKYCNEGAAYLKIRTTDNANDVSNNETITFGIRNYNGVEGVLGTSIVKKITATNPASKQFIVCIGDSLTEYINDPHKTAADIDMGSGAWVNEFSRMLTGVGDAIPNGISSLNLSNYEILGTRGSGAVKHEGRSGWSLNDYLTKASVGQVTNAFWDGSEFSLSHYISTNFSSKGIEENGSNLSVIVLLNWNNVYTDFDLFKTRYQNLIAAMKAEYTDIKIYVVGINCPPDKIFKDFSGDRSVSVASIKELCVQVEGVLEELESENTNVYHIPVLPYFYPYGSYNSRNDISECPRSGNNTLLYDDYVHPNLQGFGQIADTILAAFLNNR